MPGVGVEIPEPGRIGGGSVAGGQEPPGPIEVEHRAGERVDHRADGIIGQEWLRERKCRIGPATRGLPQRTEQAGEVARRSGHRAARPAGWTVVGVTPGVGLDRERPGSSAGHRTGRTPREGGQRRQRPTPVGVRHDRGLEVDRKHRPPLGPLQQRIGLAKEDRAGIEGLQRRERLAHHEESHPEAAVAVGPLVYRAALVDEDPSEAGLRGRDVERRAKPREAIDPFKSTARSDDLESASLQGAQPGLESVIVGQLEELPPLDVFLLRRWVEC